MNSYKYKIYSENSAVKSHKKHKTETGIRLVRCFTKLTPRSNIIMLKTFYSNLSFRLLRYSYLILNIMLSVLWKNRHFLFLSCKIQLWRTDGAGAEVLTGWGFPSLHVFIKGLIVFTLFRSLISFIIVSKQNTLQYICRLSDCPEAYSTVLLVLISTWIDDTWPQKL